MTYIVKFSFSSLFFILILPSCIYQEKISEKRVFYIETKSEIDKSDFCLIIGGGSYQLYSKKNKNFIYKVIFEPVRWSTSRGLINKDISHPDSSERLIFDKCKTDLSEIFAAYSYNSIIKLDSFKLDTITVYKIPDL